MKTLINPNFEIRGSCSGWHLNRFNVKTKWHFVFSRRPQKLGDRLFSFFFQKVVSYIGYRPGIRKNILRLIMDFFWMSSYTINVNYNGEILTFNTWNNISDFWKKKKLYHLLRMRGLQKPPKWRFVEKLPKFYCPYELFCNSFSFY